MHRPLMHWIVSAAALLPAVSPMAATATPQDMHAQALSLHRAGNPAGAAEVMQALHQQYPREKWYLYDLIDALSAAGKDKEALALREQAVDGAPSYVLEALGHSARNLGQYDLAALLYRKSATHSPNRPTPVAGEMLSLADGRRPNEALSLYEGLAPAIQAHISIQQAHAYALWRADRYLEALRGYQAVLDQQPDAREALRGRILMLARLELPWMANAFAEQHSDLLNAEERAWMVTRRGGATLPGHGSWQTLKPALIEFLDAVIRPGRCDCASARLKADVIIQNGGASEIKRLLEALPHAEQQVAEFQSLRAKAAAAIREPLDELAVYQAILAKRPNDRAALEGRIRTLASLGAARQALNLAQAHHASIIPADELQSIKLAAAQETMLWHAADDDRIKSERYRSTDEALAMLEELVQTMPDPRPALHLKVRALRDRFRMQDAVDTYAQLEARGGAIPPETRAAAADAWLYLHEPEKARDLYLGVLADKPDFFDARMGLYYAHLECEDYTSAHATLQDVLASEPEYLFADYRDLRRYNTRHQLAQAAAAMFLAYDEQQDAALQAQDQLIMRAPMDSGLRTDRAAVYGFRGWPRRALDEYEWTLAAHPDDLAGRVGRAGQWLALGHYEASREETDKLVADRPESQPVQRLAREWDYFNHPEWIVEAGWGNSTNPTVSGQHDYSVQSWLYSPPLDYRTRLFIHGYHAEGKYDVGNINYGRWGAGLEYRWYDLTLTAEGHRGLVDEDRAGATLGLAWTPSDHWAFAVQHDTNSLEVPLRAREVGVTAQSTTFDMTWRAHEGRSISLGVGYHDFSDGNERSSLLAAWTERLYARSDYMLDGRLDLYTSHNTATDRIYFNPSHDASAAITLVNDWKVWRRYERAFHHRLSFTLGNYWQEDYGNGLIAGASYEHAWTIDPRFELVYGIRFLRHPYDGEYDDRTALYLRLDTRF